MRWVMGTVAELIEQLFKTHKRPDGREYTHKDVSVALNGAIDPSYLSKLRNGKITNPGRESLLALCRFFKVAPSYFFPELWDLAQTGELHEDSPDQLRVLLRTMGFTRELEEKIAQLLQVLRSENTG